MKRSRFTTEQIIITWPRCDLLSARTRGAGQQRRRILISERGHLAGPSTEAAEWDESSSPPSQQSDRLQREKSAN
jgi:hypothetical protein